MSELLGHDYSLLELIKIRAANSLFYCIKKIYLLISFFSKYISGYFHKNKKNIII
jgi:hypothetical protein